MRILKSLVLIGAFVLPLAAQAFDVAAMSDAEREAFRQEIRNYLLDNPEVLVEAMSILEDRERQSEMLRDLKLVQDNAEALRNDGISYVGGNLNGDLTIVEFVDYRCSYCRRAHTEVAKLLETDGNIRLVVKEYPILGPDSDASSQAAISTLQLFGPEAYERLYEELIAFKGPVNEQSIRLIMGRLGLDADRVLARMGSSAVAGHIEAVHDLGQAILVSGTPTFVVGDTVLRGYLPLADMRQVVDAARAMAN